jgi:DNA-binding transcriptional regulator GbsR (MarR family)
MANAIEVSDSLSNTEEQVERAAKTVGRGVRRDVFDAIYHHKTKVKTVAQIAKRTGLSRMTVLQNGRHLASKGIARQTKKDGDTAYEKIDFFHAHKKKILALAASPKKLANLPTKRKVVVVLPNVVSIPSAGAKVQRVTIDDFASFARVKKIKIAQALPEISETKFKRGIQSIIGEPGEFKDWGGEKSDLYSTRIRLTSKRLAAAFAFKGPGCPGKLVQAKMGKNGDQGLRLFQEDADVFLVQHWREIDPSVVDLIRNLAVARSAMTGHRIFYGTIDGDDSIRLRLAYPRHFK